ncbi:MAG: 23S rRNA (guanosine(2251)-2'-O)-methyltransferase RlmB [Bacteroidota bacterium]|nr:23S rRNA (guanosine(2251)-2'-O)-methyltransferase RlmB [Bacteroidota bacterium]
MSQNNDFIFGIRAILEAIRSGKEIDKVLVRKGLSGELFQELLTEMRESKILFQQVPNEKLDRVTRKNHQGVIAFISPITYQNIEEIVPALYEKGKVPFILVLDSLTDVRNIGAIARTAECAGVDAIIVPEKGSAQINGDAIKTSAGALHYIPVCRVKSLNSTVRFLKESGIRTIAATEKASDTYFNVDMKEPLALIMGAEDTGISLELLRSADHLVRIPISGHIESLNVSAAASVLIYEAVKQRLG